MKNSIKVGNIELKSCVSLAPMAGVTDYVLRSLVRKYSKNSLITTEMISSEALIQEIKCKKRKTLDFENDLVRKDENHSPIAYQLILLIKMTNMIILIFFLFFIILIFCLFLYISTSKTIKIAKHPK